MKIDKSIIKKFDRPGPRYTSYPTAPEWSDGVTAGVYRQHLHQFDPASKTLSLYIHIPFCESLCYFCACNMNVRPTEEKYGDRYLDYLEKELDLINDALKGKATIKQLHWGGGTPTFLTEKQLVRLMGLVTGRFNVDFSGEVAIEIDPRRVTRSKMQTIRDIGFNRVSIGLQDFDPKVQDAVHREQPYEMVLQFNSWCRELGFESVNFDLIYGLPFQTPASFAETVKKVNGLRPDRIALYSFAHVPWLKKHQNKIPAGALPDSDQKLEIFLMAREQFQENGYTAIAMDHFALEDDELARAYREGMIYRNFMGYTVKPADEYLGAGVSAIGFLEGGYFQNVKTVPEYYRQLDADKLPIERGKLLTQDDIVRRWTINSIMCRFMIDKKEFYERFGKDFDTYFEAEGPQVGQFLQENLLKEEKGVLVATELGKIFVRNIAMSFDGYLQQKNAHRQFSRTI